MMMTPLWTLGPRLAGAVARRVALLRAEVTLRLVDLAQSPPSIKALPWQQQPQQQPQLAGLFGEATSSEDSAGAEVTTTNDALWHFAVPKKRTSHAKTRERVAGNLKWKMKPISHWIECPDCGEPRLNHKMWKCCVDKSIEKTRELKAAQSASVAATETPAAPQQKAPEVVAAATTAAETR